MNLDRVIAVRNSKTVYRNGEQTVKVFYSDFSKSDVLGEALNQARIEETGLNIPKIMEVTMIDGKWAIVSEYIKGKTLAQLMSDSDETQKITYMNLFVELQLEIHKKSCPQLNMLRDKMIRQIAVTDFNAITRYDLHSHLEDMPRDNKVCHGDFNPSNVVIAEDGIPYILDWSHATQGNPAADAAVTYLLFKLRQNDQDADLYLNTYSEKSGISAECILKWLPLVAAAQSVHSTSEECEMLQKWVSLR